MFDLTYSMLKHRQRPGYVTAEPYADPEFAASSEAADRGQDFPSVADIVLRGGFPLEEAPEYWRSTKPREGGVREWSHGDLEDPVEEARFEVRGEGKHSSAEETSTFLVRDRRSEIRALKNEIRDDDHWVELYVATFHSAHEVRQEYSWLFGSEEDNSDPEGDGDAGRVQDELSALPQEDAELPDEPVLGDPEILTAAGHPARTISVLCISDAKRGGDGFGDHPIWRLERRVRWHQALWGEAGKGVAVSWWTENGEINFGYPPETAERGKGRSQVYVIKLVPELALDLIDSASELAKQERAEVQLVDWRSHGLASDDPAWIALRQRLGDPGQADALSQPASQRQLAECCDPTVDQPAANLARSSAIEAQEQAAWAKITPNEVVSAPSRFSDVDEAVAEVDRSFDPDAKWPDWAAPLMAWFGMTIPPWAWNDPSERNWQMGTARVNVSGAKGMGRIDAAEAERLRKLLAEHEVAEREEDANAEPEPEPLDA